MNKAFPLRTGAWPIQGGLQSIGHAAAFRGQMPGMPTRSSVMDIMPPRSFAAVAIKPEAADMSTKSRTPSPQKLALKVEPAGGKENINVNVALQATC